MSTSPNPNLGEATSTHPTTEPVASVASPPPRRPSLVISYLSLGSGWSSLQSPGPTVSAKGSASWPLLTRLGEGRRSVQFLILGTYISGHRAGCLHPTASTSRKAGCPASSCVHAPETPALCLTPIARSVLGSSHNDPCVLVNDKGRGTKVPPFASAVCCPTFPTRWDPPLREQHLQNSPSI